MIPILFPAMGAGPANNATRTFSFGPLARGFYASPVGDTTNLQLKSICRRCGRRSELGIFAICGFCCFGFARRESRCFNLQTLVGIEPLLAVEALNEFPGGFCNRPGDGRRFHLYCSSLISFFAIFVAKFHIISVHRVSHLILTD